MQPKCPSLHSQKTFAGLSSSNPSLREFKSTPILRNPPTSNSMKTIRMKKRRMQKNHVSSTRTSPFRSERKLLEPELLFSPSALVSRSFKQWKTALFRANLLSGCFCWSQLLARSGKASSCSTLPIRRLYIVHRSRRQQRSSELARYKYSSLPEPNLLTTTTTPV